MVIAAGANPGKKLTDMTPTALKELNINDINKRETLVNNCRNVPL
jgi:hypothetical protein